MNNKKIQIFSIILVFVLATIIISIVYFLNNEDISTNNPPIYSEGNSTTIPETGNNHVIKTNSNTTLRIINEYNNDFFTADKNLLIMFGSWCSHCSEELEEVEKIVNYYNDNKAINIILIAHEYEDTITDLKSLVENDFNFGNMEILVDLKRIIRYTLDPEASTVPISYVVDDKGNVLEKNDGAITLDIAKEMLK